MDILRAELNAIYAAQQLEKEYLDQQHLMRLIGQIRNYVSLTRGCCVITDASADRSYIIGGDFCCLLGISSSPELFKEVDSSDEDLIYLRLHPEDLVEKRMLEYAYFKHVDSLTGEEKLRFKATCTIRIRNHKGDYMAVSNSTQVLYPSPKGKIWLILCCYDLAPQAGGREGIEARIVNNSTGEIIPVAAHAQRNQILSEREKEILRLIRDGKPSKLIAEELHISINTVNRHRQNILSKLSVGNSMEAVMAATLMRLM